MNSAQQTRQRRADGTPTASTNPSGYIRSSRFQPSSIPSGASGSQTNGVSMKVHSQSNRSCRAHDGQPAILKIKVSGEEKSKRIDLGLAILAATRPGERLTCAEIAAYCDCCPERINQIELKALQRFRSLMKLLEQPPVSVTSEEAAWIINCRPHEVPILVAAGLLKPLDSARPNGVTYFAASELLELAKDPTWRAKATKAVNHHEHIRTGMRESAWQMVWLALMAPQLFLGITEFPGV